MKRILLGALSAVIGIAAAVTVHCSFMIVDIDGSDMLPTFEPEQRVLVFMLSDKDDIKEGDLIACEPPYYEIDGGRGPLVRRVYKVLDSGFELTCDADLTDENSLIVSEQEVLGKIITF